MKKERIIMKRIFALTIIMTLVLAMAGCSSNGNQQTTTSQTPGTSSEATQATSEKIEFPTRAITMVVPDKAGGSTDLVARLTFANVEKILGQTVTIVNKEGSGGQLALIDVAKATPDGYTIASLTDFATASEFAAGNDVGYEIDQLTFICSITSGTNIIILGKDFPGEPSLEGLIEYAKENPGAVSVGIAAGGQSMVLSSLMDEADVELTEVRFNSGSESYTALIGGHINAAILGTKFHNQTTEQGCTTIAVTSHERFGLLPEIPTLLENGYNVLNNEVSRVYVVPSGTPQEIVDILADAIKQATDDDDFKAKLVENNESYLYRTGPEAYEVFTQKVEQMKTISE